ncbi:MAG: single-stranded-DNA-specific exonuclease RecJ [Planctomycetales bacterium]|nr:single-stranded-DNA-specific exonuclease RecJ [Planctomycetales bacterium]
MAKLWRIQPFDCDRVRQLERAAGLPSVVAQLLIARGIEDPTEAREFLDIKLSGLRDPRTLPGVAEAAQRLAAAIANKRRILIYGDYDADGMTATAILLRCMRLLGANVGFYVPNRMEDGYGLSCESLQRLAAEGTQVVVTVDCGITSVTEAETARALGLELIVTDHHEMAAQLPAADVLVHPALPGGNYPFTGLCGAAVAFKLAWALCQEVSQCERVPERMKRFLMSAVGLAALGTVADVVPLLDENRILVRYGLHYLKQEPYAGVLALMRCSKLDGKEYLKSEDVAFSLAPRLNAAGRLGQAPLAVELLTTDSLERAEELASFLAELNERRVSLERSVYLAALKQAQDEFDPHGDPALVLADRGWHAGVIGIVAGRLAEKFHRPVVVVSLDELGVQPATGSARSVPGFALNEAFAACDEHLIGHGGHQAAAGMRVSEKNLSAFRTAFCEYAAAEISAADRVAELWIDAETPLSTLNLQTVSQIEQLAPFGQANPRPVLCTSDVRLTEPARKMGAGDRHVSMNLEQHGIQMRAVAFGRGEWADALAQVTGPFSVAFQPMINDFRGRRSVELHLTDWKAKTPEHVAQAR